MVVIYTCAVYTAIWADRIGARTRGGFAVIYYTHSTTAHNNDTVVVAFLSSGACAPRRYKRIYSIIIHIIACRCIPGDSGVPTHAHAKQ